MILSNIRCLSCILDFILYFFPDKVLEMNPSLSPSAKWFLPSEAFIHKLRKHAKLLLRCWLHGFTKTFLCKLATFIVNICRDGSPGVLVKYRQMFFVLKSINFVWVKMHYNLLFWPVSHTTWTTTSKAKTERHSGSSERSWLQAWLERKSYEYCWMWSLRCWTLSQNVEVLK